MITTDWNRKFKAFVVLPALLFCLTLYPCSANSGPYLDSAHGSASYGVNRTSISSTGYSKGHCAHCHEQHASIGGSEPDPTGGPDKYTLFYPNYNSQTNSFCLTCHTDVSPYQTGGLVNRSYSYRAGGWTSDTLNDINEAFSIISPGTSHDLDDIKTFITGKWNYTSDSNPCNACHNPHMANGDPANSPNSTKSSGTRGWPASRPSQHSKDNNAWGLWGDDAGEKMNDYTTGFQAPYRYNSTTAYEPDGSSMQNGSNLTDYVTLCTDCHNNTNTIYSTTLGRNLYKFNWNVEKHGGGSATNDSFTDVIAPYQEANLGTYVLSCTDCHEPHGSSNRFLIRKGINGGTATTTVTIITTPDNTREWKSLCSKCHGSSVFDAHHPSGLNCNTCHKPRPSDFPNCIDCHYHGNTAIDGSPYNGGEHLF
jgi:hypothetical protein